MIETAKAILARGRHRADLPRGHAHAARRARPPQARRRPARAGDRRAGRPGRGDRHRGRPPRLADPAAQGPDPRRPARCASRRSTDASPALAGAVTDRIWPCVMLQWEWLGGLPPIRRAAIIGAGSWGTSLAVCLARAGLRGRPRLPDRRAGRGAARRARERALPARASTLPDSIRVMRASELELGGHDLVCLAVPARALPAVLAAHGERIPPRAGVLVLSKGLVPPLGTLPSAFAAERCRARAVAVLGGPAHAAEALEHGASVVLASLDGGVRPPARRRARRAGLDVSTHAGRHRRRARGLREERRRPRRRGRLGRRARTWPAPPPARCSPRSTRSRARAAAARDVRRARRRRRPRRHRRRRRLAQPPRRASCSSRACRRARSGWRSATSPRRSTASRCSPAVARGARLAHAGDRRPRRAGRGADRARALDGDGDRAGAQRSARAPVRAA